MLFELNDSTSTNIINQIGKFCKNSEYSEYYQSIKWLKIRNEEEKYFLYYIFEDKIIWTCSLFSKHENNLVKLYSPRGPIIDYHNKKYLACFFNEIKKWSQTKNYNFLVINPCIKYDILKNFPKNLNYKLCNRTDYDNLEDSCKLAMVDIIYDESKMLNKLPSKFRQNTRRSYRKNHDIILSTSINIKEFYDLYLQTSGRHHFNPHNIEYFQKIIDVFKDDLVCITIKNDSKPLAMCIDIKYNNKLIYLYGTSSNENRNLLGMYTMQWESIKYCIYNKIPIYDMGGVFCEENDVNNKDFGLYNFKKGYCYNGFIDIVPDIIIKLRRDQ